MTTQPKHSKTGKKGVAKSARSRQDVKKLGKKQSRKIEVERPYKSIVQKNLGHLVGKMKIKGNVKKYVAISKILSKIADLKDGHVWAWKYIASIYHGTMEPSQKFIQALNAYVKNQDTKKTRRSYFSSRHGVLVALDTSVMIDVLAGCLRGMGYRPVTYSKYMEVKKMMRKGR